LVDDNSIRVAENIEVDSSEQLDQNHPDNTVQLVGHPLAIKLKNEIEQTIARCECKTKIKMKGVYLHKNITLTLICSHRKYICFSRSRYARNIILLSIDSIFNYEFHDKIKLKI